jgi:murein L,D-transpeptidase YafK
LAAARGLLAIILVLAAGGASAGPPAALPDVDYLRVDKTARTITLYSQGRAIHRIAGIQLGDPTGPKRIQGDRRTPEGRYTIDYGNPDSAFYLSLHISYPSPRDTAYAAALGYSPGGAIFIHGQPNDWPKSGRVPGDWTDGCIAVTNAEMDLLWQAVPDGAVIDILP